MNGCSHWRSEQWEEYIDDRIPELQRAEMEDSLAECCVCLEMFTRLIEQKLVDYDGSPITTDDFVERILTTVQDDEAKFASVAKVKRNRMKSTLLHYLIAASITLIFMVNGAFDAFAEGSRLNAAQTGAVSAAYQWNGHLLEKTKNWVHLWWTTSGRDTF